jgi:hypothetical protein
MTEHSHAKLLHHRRLEDPYYEFADDVKQHPWYSHTMIMIMILLLALTLGYGVYQAHYALESNCAKTDEVVDDDGSDVVEMHATSKQRNQLGYVTMPDELLGRAAVV